MLHCIRDGLWGTISIMSDERVDDVKPEVAAEGAADQINIKVKSPEGSSMFFKVKANTKLSKVMNAFCSRSGKDMKALRFFFDGERIQETDTPASIGLSDEDEIDVMMDQVGGK